MKRQAGVLALLLSLAVCNGVHAAGTPVTVGLGGAQGTALAVALQGPIASRQFCA